MPLIRFWTLRVRVRVRVEAGVGFRPCNGHAAPGAACGAAGHARSPPLLGRGACGVPRRVPRPRPRLFFDAHGTGPARAFATYPALPAPGKRPHRLSGLPLLARAAGRAVAGPRPLTSPPHPPTPRPADRPTWLRRWRPPGPGAAPAPRSAACAPPGSGERETERILAAHLARPSAARARRRGGDSATRAPDANESWQQACDCPAVAAHGTRSWRRPASQRVSVRRLQSAGAIRSGCPEHRAAAAAVPGGALEAGLTWPWRIRRFRLRCKADRAHAAHASEPRQTLPNPHTPPTAPWPPGAVRPRSRRGMQGPPTREGAHCRAAV